jgi:hypothetical protein
MSRGTLRQAAGRYQHPVSIPKRCQNPYYCEGAETGRALLNEEEEGTAARCTFCRRALCDYCAAGVRIPYDVLHEKPWGWKEHLKQCSWVRQHGAGFCPHKKPTDEQRYDCFVCSEHFNEAWV